MVVLLCAGNRIAIPDFTSGLGVFAQPVHTMTGIIAQEMGEVEFGEHSLPGTFHGRDRTIFNFPTGKLFIPKYRRAIQGKLLIR